MATASFEKEQENAKESLEILSNAMEHARLKGFNP